MGTLRRSAWGAGPDVGHRRWRCHWARLARLAADLCMIGIMATFGWGKALGGTGELPWWEAAVAGAATRQHIPIPR
jgi:hypothetical protein